MRLAQLRCRKDCKGEPGLEQRSTELAADLSAPVLRTWSRKHTEKQPLQAIAGQRHCSHGCFPKLQKDGVRAKQVSR
jgi:hypothetical protein